MVHKKICLASDNWAGVHPSTEVRFFTSWNTSEQEGMTLIHYRLV